MLSDKDILSIVKSNKEIYNSILSDYKNMEANKWLNSKLEAGWGEVPKTTYGPKDIKLIPGDVCSFEEHPNNKGNFKALFGVPINAKHKCLNVETFNDREACWYNYIFLWLKGDIVWKMAAHQISNKYLYKVIRNEPYTYEVIQKIIAK